MKQIKRMAALMLLFMMCLLSVVPAHATGSGNVDGGGGSLNHGKDGYYWPDVGYDGVRVTVVDARSGQRVSVPETGGACSPDYLRQQQESQHPGHPAVFLFRGGSGDGGE